MANKTASLYDNVTDNIARAFQAANLQSILNVMSQAYTLFDLSGKTALITGSSQGIGYTLAEGLASAGAKIILIGRDSKKTRCSGQSVVC